MMLWNIQIQNLQIIRKVGLQWHETHVDRASSISEERIECLEICGKSKLYVFPYCRIGSSIFPSDARRPSRTEPVAPNTGCCRNGTPLLDSLTSSKAKKNIGLLQLLFRKFLKPILIVSNQ